LIKQIKCLGEIIQEGDSVVAVGANWCSNCKMFKPIYEEISNEVEQLSFHEIDATMKSKFVAEYKIGTLPTFLYFKDGEFVDKFVGTTIKRIFKEWLESHK